MYFRDFGRSEGVWGMSVSKVSHVGMKHDTHTHTHIHDDAHDKLKFMKETGNTYGKGDDSSSSRGLSSAADMLDPGRASGSFA